MVEITDSTCVYWFRACTMALYKCRGFWGNNTLVEKVSYSSIFDPKKYIYMIDILQDRKEARKYAVLMLKNKFIRDTVNKATFSEQCYYTFDPNISEGTLFHIFWNIFI